MSCRRSRGPYVKGAAHCLTRSRCVEGGHWVSTKRRRMRIPEMERLQGLPPGLLQIPDGVSERQYAGMLGNATSVSVIGRVALALLRTVGLVDPRFPDVWNDGATAAAES